MPSPCAQHHGKRARAPAKVPVTLPFRTRLARGARMPTTMPYTWLHRRVPAMSAENFGGLLRRYRRARGLSQEELAERSGVSTEAISLLERGRTQTAQRFTVSALSAALCLEGDDA